MAGIPFKAAMPATTPMTVAQDVISVKAGTSKPCLVRRCVIEQSSDTDSEQLRIIFSRFSSAATVGAGGTTIVPKSPLKGAPAATAVVRRNDTTATTGGTQEVLEERGWNVLTGLDAIFDPPIEISPGEYFVANLSTAPVDAITPAGVLEFDEIQ
jgi:hypothetical protein